MPNLTCTPIGHRQKGVTLIELLISLVIGLIVIGAVSSVFLTILQTNRAKTAIDNSSETLRYAHYILTNQIRNASLMEVSSGGELVLTLQRGVADCLGSTPGPAGLTSRFSFADGALRCRTTDTGTPQVLAAGFTNISFEYGCILTAATPPLAREVRNANFATAEGLCDPDDDFDSGEKVTTVFVTFNVNPLLAQGGEERGVTFSATARGIMGPRITRVTQIVEDPEVVLSLWAIVDGERVRTNTTCEFASVRNDDQESTNSYIIIATRLDGTEDTTLTGGFSVRFTNIDAAAEGSYQPSDFETINIPFTVDIFDDHIAQGNRRFSIQLIEDEAFGSFENISIDTTPVISTISDGSCEPDGGTGPDDTVTVRIFATSEDGVPLATPNISSGAEGQRLWFTVRAFDPQENEINSVDGTVTLNISASDSDVIGPTGPANIGIPFFIDLLPDLANEGNETFTVSLVNNSLAGAIVSGIFENVIVSNITLENTIEVTIIDQIVEEPGLGEVGVAAAGESDVDIQWPTTHKVGDLGILIIETSGDQQLVAPPDNWIEAFTPRSDTSNAEGSTLHVYYQFATSNNMPPVTISQPALNHVVGQIFTFVSIDFLSPIQNPPSILLKTEPSTTVTNPSANAVRERSPVLLIATRPNDTANTNQFGDPLNPNLAELREIAEAGTDIGNGGGFRLAVGTRNSPGGTGVTTGSGPNTTNVSATIVLNPR